MSKSKHEQNAPKIGALHSELKIELHTYYAISTWNGRKKTDRVAEIIGMTRFFRFVGRINRDAELDNPYADVAMLKLEQLISEAHQAIQKQLNDIEQIISGMAEQYTKQVSLSDISSEEPLNITVYSHTPIGYRCVYLLVGFDQLAMKLMQAFHYGLISRSHRDTQLQQAASYIRRVIGIARSYRSVAITRRDMVNPTENIKNTLNQLGEIYSNILLGIKRSMFSPPINKDSVLLLQNSTRKKGKIKHE